MIMLLGVKSVNKRERSELEVKRLAEMLEFDKIKRGDYDWLIGVDEVGRGPLAGPVVACAVVLPLNWNLPGINDSKKLSEKRRTELADIIKDKSEGIGLGFVNNKKIDRFNIRNATKMAMIIAVRRCIENLSGQIGDRVRSNSILKGEDKSKASVKNPSELGRIRILIDGNMEISLDKLFGEGYELTQETVVQGDSKSLSVGAASIVAKVARDEFMKEYAKLEPEYGFDKHKGYGTKAHYSAIESYGLSPIHRKSFLSKVLDKMEEELI